MQTEAPQHCDTAIRGADVIDGGGGPRIRADVAIAGERIVAVGELGRTLATREIDGAGHAVAPGLIDVHSHDDWALLSQPAMAPKVSQGVTTVVAGNCGVSLAPMVLADWPPPGSRW